MNVWVVDHKLRLEILIDQQQWKEVKIVTDDMEFLAKIFECKIFL